MQGLLLMKGNKFMRVISVILALSLLLSQSLFAATAQTNSVLMLGGDHGTALPSLVLPSSNLSSIVTLGSGTNSTTGSNYYAFYSMSAPSSTTAYQVPAGKTLYITGMYIESDSGSQGSIQFGYATATFSNNTSSAPTGAIYYSATSAVTDAPLRIAGTLSFPEYYTIPLSFPANSFPFVRVQTSTQAYTITLMGYLK